MKMDVVAGSGNDEFFTPEYAISPILKYVEANKTVWCPFDTEKSLFVKKLKENGNKVLYTHICNGEKQDFFNINPSKNNVDYIISNPPYSIKGKVLQKLFDLDIPFAMLVGVVGLFESQQRFEMFQNNEFEIMYFNKRIAYFKSYEEQKPSLNPPFSSVYVCHKMLPQQICFETITK